MSFRKYMHIERFGNTEVEGIELGQVYVFPKLDGTNSSAWWNERIRAGSRNRELDTINFEQDNAGFASYVGKEHPYTRHLDFLLRNRNLRLYGEWLVPHTLKTYRDDVWNKFWIFDVYNDETDQFLSYEAYKPLLDEFNLDYIPPLAIIKNGSYENFIHVLNQNNLFIKDGEGIGEGIVIKNYDYYNKFRQQIWAKIVAAEFKEKHIREMGAPESSGKMVEELIVEQFCTEALIDKVFSKIYVEMDGWTSKYIPRLLETTFYDLVREDIWQILKDYKNPSINFKTLKALVIMKVKQVKKELF